MHDREFPETNIGLKAPPPALGEKGLSFLLEATLLLGQSLEVETTLASVARLSLPHFGSWCVVDLVDGDHIRRLAIIHPDEEKQALADELLEGWPPQRDDPLGAPSAIRSARSEVVFPVTDEMLIRAARSPENLAILRALEIGSFMTIPLRARGRVLGAITYVSPNHGDSFGEADLRIAEDLAARCAMAIDNAGLLRAAHQAEEAATIAQARAEEANLVKMRFLSTMSHELRTPLNAIAGYAELLASGVRGDLTDSQLKDVHRIQANEQHLLTLVESVLSYAKIEAGRIEFGLEDVSLSRALQDVELTIAPLAEERGVAFLAWQPGVAEGLMVRADAEMLGQILVNLLANAVKFSRKGGKVAVVAEGIGDVVEVRISDDGIGIAPEFLETIFEPFVQVDGGYTQTHGGTGLGLAISRDLARGMGGDLAVESQLERGSTFTLTLSRGRGGGDARA